MTGKNIFFRLIRALAVVAAAGALAVALAVAALYALIVPRIDDFRPQLAGWASTVLGADVAIERLSAQRDGTTLTLTAQGLVVTDVAGQPGLVVPQAQLQLPLAALVHGRIGALELQSPKLWLRRATDGTLWLAGKMLAADATARPSAAAQWLLAQPGVAIHSGRVYWVDALLDREAVLTGLFAQLRRRGANHIVHLEAGQKEAGPFLQLDAVLEPPAGWALVGERAHWRGHFALDAAALPVAPLADALLLQRRLGVVLQSGRATLQAQGVLHRGQMQQLDATVAVQQLNGVLQTGTQPLQDTAFGARVAWQRTGPSAQLTLDDLMLQTANGVALSGAALTLDYEPDTAPAAAPTRLRLSQIDLRALAQLTPHLPLPDALQQTLDSLQPAGTLAQLDAQWHGPLRKARHWHASGQVQGLELAAQALTPSDEASEQNKSGATAPERATPSRPGVSGLNIDFATTFERGHATLAINQGSLTFPGIFEEPQVPVDQLQAQASWQHDADQWQIQVSQLDLANADAAGSFSGLWRTGNEAAGEMRLPGYLELQGRLERGDGARVHRYLPLVLPADARHYVRDAIDQGTLSDIVVNVHGPLAQVPFDAPGEDGLFAIGGNVTDGIMTYVPPRFQDAGEAPWPALIDLAGRLEFEGASMRVRNASAAVRGHPGWTFTHIQADIADFDNARVTVESESSGALQAALDIVRSSPAAGYTRHVLDDAQAQGDARLNLALDLPIGELTRSTVNGEVVLQQNDIALGGPIPALAAAKGTVTFTETGFAINNAQARALGGPITLHGGMDDAVATTRLAVAGRATAEGLQQAVAEQPDLAAWTAVADTLQGDFSYQLALDLAAGGIRQLELDTDLQGLAMGLPAPMDKPAPARWPLHVRWQHDAPARRDTPAHLDLRLASRLDLQWSWPQGLAGAPQGTTALGTAAVQKQAAAGAPGLTLNANLDALDVDAWQEQLDDLRDHLDTSAPGLPDRWQIQIHTLHLAGRTLSEVTSSGRRAGRRWIGDLNASDVAGQIEYEPGQDGRAAHLRARLSRLRLQPRDDAKPKPPGATARNLPSLDVRAEQLIWDDMDLGQLVLRANADQGRAAGLWRIEQLQLTTPAAQLHASGQRQLPARGAGSAPGQTELTLDLAIYDAGGLLQRLGKPGLVEDGAGALHATLQWPGSPLDFSIARASGQLVLELADGRFVKIDPGAGRLLGILSLQALPRRLTFDFDDVFGAGHAFDRVQASARLDRGVLHTDDLKIMGVSATVAMSGQVDLEHKTQDLHAYILPKLDAGAAALATTLINPALGAAAFIAQLALREPLGRAAARELDIRGTWSDPKVSASAAPSVPAPDVPAAAAPPQQAAQPPSSSSDYPMPAAGEANP